MPAGLQVIGQHGVLQIDENYRNYALAAVLQLRDYPGTPWAVVIDDPQIVPLPAWPHYRVQMDVDAELPIVVMDQPGQAYLEEICVPSIFPIGPNRWRIVIYTNTDPAQRRTRILVYGLSSTVPAGTMFEVRNAQAALVFSDAMRVMKLVSAGAAPPGKAYGLAFMAPESRTHEETDPYTRRIRYSWLRVYSKHGNGTFVDRDVIVDFALDEGSSRGVVAQRVGHTSTVDITGL
ncbi:TPA: hypothetical protein UM674_000654 [Stenotrophomonas maltophilia]|nr:hypothetical protein [Stenotrophomonas maltophilia]